MSNATNRPHTSACRGGWWGPGAQGGQRSQPRNGYSDSWPSSEREGLRVSDAERQVTADQLKAHFAAGRLDMDEYDERLQQALAAKTRRDLEGVLKDLPPANVAAAQARHGRPFFVPVLVAIAVIAVLAFTLSVAHGFFFPWWITPIAFFVVSRHWRRRWHTNYWGPAR